MKLVNMPEAVADWSRIPATTIPGSSGTAHMRAHQIGDVRLRLVEYSAGYLDRSLVVGEGCLHRRLSSIESGYQPRRAGAISLVLLAELRAQQRLFRADAREQHRQEKRRDQHADP